MREYVAVLLVLLTGLATRADQNRHPNTLRTWDEFTKVIKDHNIKTIDQLLPALPSDFLKGYTLIYSPKALHRELASMKRPRVIVYGTDAKFIMAYNSNLSGGAAVPGDTESIETIEFRDDGARLREVVFDGVSSPLDRPIAVNPQKCTQCHGADPKGFWDPYNHWAGVYGSLSRGMADFIRIPTSERSVSEYDGFQQFLNERKTNPRYSILDLTVTTLSQMSKDWGEQHGEPMYRSFDSSKMNDALVFKDGHTYATNQTLGILIGVQNFARLGRSLASLPADQRTAFQYLFKGISLDENFTDLFKNKHFNCLKTINDFIPAVVYTRSFSNYSAFQDKITDVQKTDYNHSKWSVELANVGLTKMGAGFSSEDPFDLDTNGRALSYDSISPSLIVTKTFGMSGSTALLYAFYLMNLPYDDLSTAADGSRFNFYYGNGLDCLDEYGMVTYKNCLSGDIEKFVTKYIPASFYTDSKIDKMACEDLAKASQSAIEAFLKKRSDFRATKSVL